MYSDLVVRTMKVCGRRFNLYFALAMAFALLCGCQTEWHKKKPVAALRIHLEVSPDSSETSQTVSVLRADPVSVTVSRDPILTEANIVAAKVIQTPGGFAIEVRFDENGTWLLEQYTASNPGRHFAIFGQWGEKLASSRWLAAPLITHRIANGILTFTPDASRAEADELVLGLNNDVKNMQNQK
jgi:preprotein translocase subunit SecD